MYVRTMSAQHLTKNICLTKEMLCGHNADIVRTYSPGIYVRTIISFFGFQLSMIKYIARSGRLYIYTLTMTLDGRNEDDNSPIMLKHLGPRGLGYLTNLYNNVLKQSIIPLPS